jgi:hypothetical protein
MVYFAGHDEHGLLETVHLANMSNHDVSGATVADF